MKKRYKVMVLALMVAMLFTTGCTKYVKEGKKAVIFDKTGQSLTANILCKPEEEELLKLYQEHESSLTVKLDDLPTCKTFKVTSLKYESLWESIFVKPLAWVILKLGYLVKNMGISVMLIGLIIRLVMLPLSIKSAAQSVNMAKAKPEVDRIEKKYRNKTDNESLMAKSQETMLVYKKYGINPVSGCLTAFIQLPLFFAFLEAINRVPAIFEGKFLGMNLGMTPWVGIRNGQYIYIVLIGLIIATTYFSFKNTMASNSGGTEAEKQMQFMFKFMIIMISIASFSLPTAIALYWIVTNAIAVVQNIIIKKVSSEPKVIKPEKNRGK